MESARSQTGSFAVTPSCINGGSYPLAHRCGCEPRDCSEAASNRVAAAQGIIPPVSGADEWPGTAAPPAVGLVLIDPLRLPSVSAKTAQSAIGPMSPCVAIKASVVDWTPAPREITHGTPAERLFPHLD
jgi:hypothetical protein